jgi:hypothetical protein
MNIIATPQQVTTTAQHLAPSVDRECFLVAKRSSQGLSEQERQELASIYASLGCPSLSAQEVDQLAELHSEGRTFKAEHVNFHE